ncbi:MAG: N-formylglutamate amidohydrolase [Clostridia bacterium]|nr:N-formylglutamate amidohydrolase [Clostridia bacterium]
MEKYNILNNTSKKIQLINENNHKYPFIISIPHSGTLISENMNSNLVDNIILANMDWYLPKFYRFLDDMGFTVIINNVSRYMIDTNRDLESKSNDLLYNKNLIYTKTTFNKDMYKLELSKNEIQYRIDNYYIPYHKEIEKNLKEKLKYFDKVYLIDLHSFGKNVDADIVLGNDFGKTTSKEFFEIIKNNLEECNFKVKENAPYRGGFITRNYKEKFKNCETLQIELWYGAYIDNREFVEEYKPSINKKLFYNAQNKMKNFFDKLKKLN